MTYIAVVSKLDATDFQVEVAEHPSGRRLVVKFDDLQPDGKFAAEEARKYAVWMNGRSEEAL